MLMGMVYIDLEIWGSIELKSGKRNGIKWELIWDCLNLSII
jgi:hypothetical protein